MLIGLTAPLTPTRILLISDIHGNYPALMAIARELDATAFHYIVNCGDCLVYAPFPNETLRWLSRNKALSILGNTDKKVINLLNNRPFAKPRKPEKRIMYSSTADILDEAGQRTLLALPESETLVLHGSGNASPTKQHSLGIFHGSPTDPDEFLFADTPDDRFHELAAQVDLPDCRHRPFAQSVPQIPLRRPFHQSGLGREDVRRRSTGQLCHIGNNRRKCQSQPFQDQLRYSRSRCGNTEAAPSGNLCHDVFTGQETELILAT